MTYPSGDVPHWAPTSNTAIISLIMGILGLTLLPFIGSIVAVILGPMARREIQASGGSLSGEGLATAGTVLGVIGIALAVLAFCGIAILVGIPFCLAMLGLAVNRTTGLLLPVFLSFI